MKAWLPVLIGISLIALSSSDWFSSTETSGPFRWLYQAIFGPVPNPQWGRVHFYIRKSCHFFGYGVFGLLWLRAWRMAVPRFHYLQDALLALAGAGVIASLDEFHQAFLPLRTGSPWDVLLDCSGVAFAEILAFLVLRLFQPEKLEHPLVNSIR